MPRVKRPHRLTKEEREKGVLTLVKRLGKGRYLRRRVKDPEKIKREEKLLERMRTEEESAWKDPAVYVHIAWTSKNQLTEAEVKIRLKGWFWSWNDVRRTTREKLQRYAGWIPHFRTVMMPSSESPGLYYLTIKDEPHGLDFKYYYEPQKTARPGTGLGKGIKDLRGW